MHRNRLRLFSFICFFFSLTATLGYYSAQEDWQTLTSQHATIQYPKRLEKLAQICGSLCDQVHEAYDRYLWWKPREKILIILNDMTDSFNGSTTAALHDGITFNTVPPDSDNSTNFYDSWIKLLVVHEYGHFFNQDPSFGIFDSLRSLFGDVTMPNLLNPAWMQEGLAVNLESIFTTAGRAKSTGWEAILRARVEEGSFFSENKQNLTNLYLTNPYYPFGDLVYLYGFHLMRQMAKSNNPEADSDQTLAFNLGAYSVISAKPNRLSLYDFNGNAAQANNKSFKLSWMQWKEQQAQKAHSELRKIQSEALTPYKTLLPATIENSPLAQGLAINRSGTTLAFTMQSADRRQGLYLLDIVTHKLRWVRDKNSGQGLAFTPDDQHLITSEIHPHDLFYEYSDLEIIHLASGKRQWLSNLQRLKDPDIDSTGQKVCFVFIENQTAGLGIADLIPTKSGTWSLGPIQKVYTPPFMGRVANPKFGPDETIYFSLRDKQTLGESIAKFELTEKKLTVLTDSEAIWQYPTVTPLGQVFAICNRTGISNLYEILQNTQNTKDQSNFALRSNVTTALYFPVIHPKKPSEYFAIRQMGNGMIPIQASMVSNTLDPAQITISMPQETNIRELASKISETNEQNAAPPYPTKSYNSLSTLLPRALEPVIGGVYLDPYLAPYVGANIMGYDVLGFHTYTALLAANSPVGTFDYGITYTNLSFNFPLLLNIQGYSANFSQIANSTNLYYTRIHSYAIGATLPLVETYWSVNFPIWLSYSLQDITVTQPNTFNHKISTYSFPNQLAFQGGFLFTNAETSRKAIATEGGGTTLANVTYVRFTNDKSLAWFTAKADQYFRLTDHMIISPSGGFTVTSEFLNNGTTDAILQAGLLTTPLASTNTLTIRGYPIGLYAGKQAFTSSLNLYAPVWNIFQGVTLFPIFFKTLSLLVFAEMSGYQLPGSSWSMLPSAGTHLRLEVEIFSVPFSAIFGFYGPQSPNPIIEYGANFTF